MSALPGFSGADGRVDDFVGVVVAEGEDAFDDWMNRAIAVGIFTGDDGVEVIWLPRLPGLLLMRRWERWSQGMECDGS